jgi:predicted SAM-dependent methyltransferase
VKQGIFNSTARWLTHQIENSELNRASLKRRLYGIDRLNMGCTSYFVENWLNIGLFPEDSGFPYGVLKKVGNSYVLHFDLRNDLPIREDSVHYIYASHFIEHLSLEEGMAFLKRCYKLMRKGALIRLTCPDLQLWVEKYYANEMDFFNKFYSIAQSYPNLKTKGEIFVGQFHGWEHRWLYDFQSIEDILERAGFSNIDRKKPFESLIPDIEKLEPNSEARLMETLYAEAVKGPDT